MKIVFLSGLYPPHTKGGGEISTYLIAEGLKTRGHEVQVITEENSKLGLLKKPLFERRQSRKIAMRLKRILSQNNLVYAPGTETGVIVHAHDFRSALALSKLDLPNAVVTVRDYAPICGTTNNILADGSRCRCTWHDVVRTKRFQEVGFPRNYARAWQYWYNTPYRKEAFKKIKNQIFISQAQQKEIEESLDLGEVQKSVIYNPVSEEYISTAVQAGRRGSVLYAGRLEDYKGVGLLLAAWKEAARHAPEAHLTLAGEGAQKNEYEKWVAKYGLQYRVTFKGRVPYERLMRMYDEASIVVAPHIWTEPFGRAVVEAMARGKTVIAANSGGPAEIIQDGRTGLLFEKGSPEKLREALQRALTFRPYDFKEIGGSARRWVQQNLTSKKIAKQYEDFYREILAKTSSTDSARMVS